MLDFLKAEDFASSNSEGTFIIAAKIGSTTVIPCLMQFFAGIAGLFPLYKTPPQFVIVSCFTRIKSIQDFYSSEFYK